MLLVMQEYCYSSLEYCMVRVKVLGRKGQVVNHSDKLILLLLATLANRFRVRPKADKVTSAALSSNKVITHSAFIHYNCANCCPIHKHTPICWVR